jgi:hypothetical protein
LFGEAFRQVFSATESFEVAEEVGRDVLIVRGLLTDVISGDPPSVAGSVSGDIGWAWEATIILELRDSMSDEILARTADRRRVEGPFAVGTISTLVTPRVAQTWSLLLAQRLQELAGVDGD